MGRVPFSARCPERNRAADAVEGIHARMLESIYAAGGDIEAVLFCPHLASDECECRKPKPGLLTRAARELGLDLTKSVFVGDAETDVAAARAAGCRPILVLTGRGRDAAAGVGDE